jgi:hypothetical protein
VASAIPSVLEIAGGGSPTMVVTRPESTTELCRAIVNLLNDHPRAGALTREAYARFSDVYTIGVIADATMDCYWDCAERSDWRVHRSIPQPY